MPKLKTNQFLAKRVKITRSGKIKSKKAGQDHFNARESGKTTRNKRRDVNVSKTFHASIKTLMPYN